jgi:SprT protein
MNGTQLQRNKIILEKYIPAKAAEILAQWIYVYDFKLKIKKSRATKLGDYRPPIDGNHLITINNNLNQYAFLLTLIHEVAHLTNWQKHKNRVKPHGNEWKEEFKLLMKPFLELSIFPDDVLSAILKYLNNPAASSCSDNNLQRVLKKHDTQSNLVLLESMPAGSVFKSKGAAYRKLERVRTRYLCINIETNKKYLFSGVAEVALTTLEKKP